MDSLSKIIELVLKHELAIALLTRKGPGVPDSLEIDELNPVAQEVAQLDEVDRNIIQELSHKFANMIERGTNAAKATGLAADGSGANGTVSGNKDGNSGTPIFGST